MMKTLKESGGIVSFSRLDRFDTCPRAYLERYGYDKPEPGGEAANFGKLVHYMIQQAIRMEADLDNNVDDFIVHIMSGESQWGQKDELEEMARLWQESDRKDEALAQTRKALQLWRTIPRKGYLLAEQHFKVRLPGTEYEMQGYVDIIANNQLWDWKTGGNVKKYLGKHQLGLYAWGVGKSLNVDPQIFERKYAFLGLDDQILWEDRTSISEALNWARNIIQEIESAEEFAKSFGEENCFPKKPGPACKWCRYQDICRENKGLVIPEQIESLEEAQEVASAIIELELSLKKAKDVLENYCKANGTVELNGEYFGIYPGSVKREWNKEGLYKLLQFNKLDWTKVFSVDSKAITALTKKNPEIEAVIKTLVTEKLGSPTFKHQQSPPAQDKGKVAVAN